MLSTILPNAYLPPVSWWVIALQYKQILIENHETYPKQTYRNRCYIYSANGMLPLSIPVKKVNGNHTLIAKIETDGSKNWQLVHWRSIEAAYNKSPYFLYYKDYFEPFYSSNTYLLAELNIELIHVCIRLLKMEEISISFTDDFLNYNNSIGFKELLDPKIPASQVGLTSFPRYIQAFESKYGFLENLSIIDVLFNLGPDSSKYLRNVLSINLMS